MIPVTARTIHPHHFYPRRPRNGRPSLENGSWGLKKSSRDIDYTFPSVAAKCPAAEK